MAIHLAKPSSPSASAEEHIRSIATTWHDCRRYERLNVPCPFRKAEMEEFDRDPRREGIPVPRGVREPARPRRPTRELPKLVAIPSKSGRGRTGGGTKSLIDTSRDLVSLPRLPGVLVPIPPKRVGGRPKRSPARTPLPLLPDGIPGVEQPSLFNPRPRGATGTTSGGIPGGRNLNFGDEPFPFNVRAYNQAFNTKPAFSMPRLPSRETVKSPLALGQSDIALMELWVQAAALAETTYAPLYAQALQPSTNTGGAQDTSTSSASTAPQTDKGGVTGRDVGKAATAAGAIAAGAAGAFKAMKGGGGGGFQFPSMPGDPSEGLFRAP